MNILKIEMQKPADKLIENAASYLKKKNIIVHPTETVYGIAGIITSHTVIQQITKLKGRSLDQPFSIMVNSIDTILKTTGVTDDKLGRFLESLLPGAVTVLIPRLKDFKTGFWNKFDYLGFRYPDHELSLKLVEFTGHELITTSANLSGEPAPKQISEIPERLLRNVMLVLDGGRTKYSIPSTVVKVETKPLKLNLIRQGAVSRDLIEKAFAKL